VREEYDSTKIIQGMIGREITNMYPKRDVEIGEEALRVENLTIEHEFIEGKNKVEDISFSVRKGEVLGLAGLVGAGRTETVSAIFGMLKKKAGSIYIEGEKANIPSTEYAVKNGLAMVTEDRKKYGLVFIWDIMKNISISDLRSISNFKLFISARKEKQAVMKHFQALRIKAPSMQTNVSTLSGGNQQKVVLARSLNIMPKVVFLDEPTKGIDVGSKNEIYHIINELAKEGVAVVMISSELPELMAMCDRFIVLAEGQVAGEFTKEEATEMKIMNAAVRTFKKIES
jgi:D-xylose transport system ATP-binding protein